jgi:hypothetical protein
MWARTFWRLRIRAPYRLAGERKLIGSGEIQRHFFRGHSASLAQALVLLRDADGTTTMWL